MPITPAYFFRSFIVLIIACLLSSAATSSNENLIHTYQTSIRTLKNQVRSIDEDLAIYSAPEARKPLLIQRSKLINTLHQYKSRLRDLHSNNTDNEGWRYGDERDHHQKNNNKEIRDWDASDGAVDDPQW